MLETGHSRCFDDESNLWVSNSVMTETAKAVVETIKNKLPKEHHRTAIIDEVLSEVKSILKLKKLNL